MRPFIFSENSAAYDRHRAINLSSTMWHDTHSIIIIITTIINLIIAYKPYYNEALLLSWRQSLTQNTYYCLYYHKTKFLPLKWTRAQLDALLKNSDQRIPIESDWGNSITNSKLKSSETLCFTKLTQVKKSVFQSFDSKQFFFQFLSIFFVLFKKSIPMFVPVPWHWLNLSLLWTHHLQRCMSMQLFCEYIFLACVSNFFVTKGQIFEL